MGYHDRIRRALAESTTAREDAIRWLELLHADWREVERALSRALTLLTAVAIGFFLIVGGDATEFAVAGLKVVDMAVVSLVLALAFAYLYSSVVGLIGENVLYYATFANLTSFVDQGAYREDLEAVLVPPNSFIYTTSRLAPVRAARMKGLRRILGGITMAKVGFVLLAPVALCAYMFVRLLEEDDLPAGLTVTAAVLAALLAVSNWPALVTAVYAYSDPDTPARQSDAFRAIV